MTDENNGNGTKLKVEVHTAELVLIQKQLTDIHNLLDSVFGVNGICPRERAANEAFRVEVTQKRETIYTHIRGLWFAFAALAGGAWVIIQQLWKD